jgi:hypothetical protein
MLHCESLRSRVETPIYPNKARSLVGQYLRAESLGPRHPAPPPLLQGAKVARAREGLINLRSL